MQGGLACPLVALIIEKFLRCGARSLEPNLPKQGKGVGSRGYVEEDLPVALMHSIVFRSFFSLLDDGSDMKELRMCWQVLQQPVIKPLAFPDAG
jgi:hypothetical protein